LPWSERLPAGPGGTARAFAQVTQVGTASHTGSGRNAARSVWRPGLATGRQSGQDLAKSAARLGFPTQRAALLTERTARPEQNSISVP